MADSPITVYTARSVITMNASLPRADAIAVRDDRIVEVGSLDTLQPWLSLHPHKIDRRFEDAVITPGFIDPHLHPAMAAVILPMRFITALEWRLPWETVPATITAAAFDARLAQLAAEHHSDSAPLIIWGHHERWHEPMSRARINARNATTPIIVWNRSFHELTMNDGALNLLGINEAEAGNRHQVDLPRGRFFEVGLGYAIRKLNRFILAPERFRHGLQRLSQVVTLGGHTTIGDMAVGIFDFDTEIKAMKAIIDTPDTPFRTELIAHAALLRAGHDVDAGNARIDALPEHNTHRLRFAKRIKLFADGAFFSELAMLQAPGYIDGHEGEWLTVPEKLLDDARYFWHQGYRIHVHVTGDLGVELALDTLAALQWEKPRFDHGFTLEHFGYCTPEQIRRAAKLGANISANVYYLHELSAIYTETSVGYERASSMARLGSAFAAGITTALHSDFTMAPAEPLRNAWVAVNRLNVEGELMGPHERLTPEQALAAITINPAHVLDRANDIGSLRAGKKADFTVLAEDPLDGDPMELKNIEIVRTVFEGEV
ncbi:MAG: amidohydrolase family protein [Pseudomonadota bacterium]